MQEASPRRLPEHGPGNPQGTLGLAKCQQGRCQGLIRKTFLLPLLLPLVPVFHNLLSASCSPTGFQLQSRLGLYQPQLQQGERRGNKKKITASSKTARQTHRQEKNQQCPNSSADSWPLTKAELTWRKPQLPIPEKQQRQGSSLTSGLPTAPCTTSEKGEPQKEIGL